MATKVNLQRRDSLPVAYLHDSILATKSLPFAVNPRGLLIHRVRHLTLHFSHGRFHHHSVNYWCGNCAYDVELTSDPPTTRLLCVNCEANAVSHGEQPADVLAGRHVHIGKIRAVRVCCQEKSNTN